MNRRKFISISGLIPLTGFAMNLKDLTLITDPLQETDTMPILFVGHGSPTNALENNEFTEGWHNVVSKIPKPQTILCISAHWETKGTMVTAMKNPQTIHDFGGFAPELYAMQYNASGSPELANEVKNAIKKTDVGLSQQWGLDHGCWVPLLKMYPDADIPVIQISLDYSKGAQYHYDLAKELHSLRKKGILIVGSGNMVHNLRRIQLNSFNDINQEFGFDWALEMNSIFKKKISERDHKALIDYESLSPAAKLAIPSTEHYFPLLYILALQNKNEDAVYFNDKAVAGSLTMTSVYIGSK